ncbi:MAG TPA: hypothetical protein VGB20_06470 [bacterium]
MGNPWCDYLRAIQHPVTGLLQSFYATTDPQLHRVAFTYDQALVVLALTHGRQTGEASRVLDFYRVMPFPDPATCDYNTAYRVWRCLPTLEYVFQVGPTSWVALAMIRYAEATGRRSFIQKAADLLDWIRRRVDHHCGGVVMGIYEPWSSRMSVENNWVYYAALRALAERLAEGPMREAVAAEQRGVRRWLGASGGNRGEGDAVKALDVYTHALLVGPNSHLDDSFAGDQTALAAWAKSWIGAMEASFRVPGGSGYDFTDAQEAQYIGRKRVAWLEGTEQAALAFMTWIPFFEARRDSGFARELTTLANEAHAYVLRQALTTRAGLAVPNTDAPEPVRTFSDGWLARPATEPALNGTTWTYFVGAGFNPFTMPLRDGTA